MKETLKHDILGVVYRNAQKKPLAIVFGFRHIDGKLEDLEKMLRRHFGPASTTPTGHWGHQYRRTFRRQEDNYPYQKLFPNATNIHVQTAATLDVWNDADGMTSCSYLNRDVLLERLLEWSSGQHATLCVATSIETVTPNRNLLPTVGYQSLLHDKDQQLLCAKLLPDLERHQHNGYVLLTRRGQRNGA